MKLTIEQWVLEKAFSEKVSNLFQESIICYKHGAYRASLLFSYLSFSTYIKESLIQAKIPDNIELGRWNSIQQELQDDDKWEKRVFDELNNGSKPVFNIKEDLRQQIRYWKDRRNDCAHFKNNEIDSYHVDSFWSFLKSNLIKITIEGGKANLLKKFIDHFDITKTPQNTDYTHLIKEIENAVDINEFESFIVELENIIDPLGFYDSEIIKIINKVLEICPNNYIEATIKYLKETNKDIELIAIFPDKVNTINYSKTEIRELWKKRLFINRFSMFVFSVYSALIRNNLIPSSQLKEAFETLFDNFEQTRHRIPSDTIIRIAIITPILGEVVFNKAIIGNQLTSFMWVNSKCGLISLYIENYPLRTETVEKLCSMFDYDNYSWWLRDAVINIFSSNPAIKETFHEIANQHDFEIPHCFE